MHLIGPPAFAVLPDHPQKRLAGTERDLQAGFAERLKTRFGCVPNGPTCERLTRLIRKPHLAEGPPTGLAEQAKRRGESIVHARRLADRESEIVRQLQPLICLCQAVQCSRLVRRRSGSTDPPNPNLEPKVEIG
jgi:hypothetical protein